MNDTVRLVMCTVAYAILFGWSVYTLASPAEASDSVGNYVHVPAVQNMPPQVGKWKQPPTLIVCDYAPVQQLQVQSAVYFWARLGHSFNIQYKSDPLNKCLESKPEGYVLIHLVTEGIKMEEGSLAQTHFYVDNGSHEIKWAVIYMRTKIKETVLEHELGHALGFLHFNETSHLMNQKWELGGWETKGLESKRR